MCSGFGDSSTEFLSTTMPLFFVKYDTCARHLHGKQPGTEGVKKAGTLPASWRARLTRPKTTLFTDPSLGNVYYLLFKPNPTATPAPWTEDGTQNPEPVRCVLTPELHPPSAWKAPHVRPEVSRRIGGGILSQTPWLGLRWIWLPCWGQC